MLRPRSCAAALAVWCAGVPALAQTPDPAEAALTARLVAARAELAEAAFAVDLFREASTHAAAALRLDPGHAVQSMTARLKALAPAEFVRRYRDAVPKHARAFRKRAPEQLRPLAAEYFALAEAADAAGDAARAERLLGVTYEVDPDHQKALQALKKRDYEAIFNYGVLPKADKQEARRLLAALGGGFLGRSELGTELEHWNDAWGLRTRHYRFVTNARHATVFAFAQACEDLHEALGEFMKAAKQPLRELSKPCAIYLFASKNDYECVLRLQGVEPADSNDALGFYSTQTKTGYFFYDAEFYAGDTTLLFETFWHEGSHQMFDLRWKAPYRGAAQGSPLFWVEEGFAVHLESLAVTEKDGRRSRVFGTVVDDDLKIAIAAAASGDLMPMTRFAHIDHDGWNAYQLGYQHAALMVHWLLMGEGGKRRQSAFDLLQAERQTAGLRKGTLFDLLGMPAEKIDAALREHAAAIDRSLPKRKCAN